MRQQPGIPARMHVTDQRGAAASLTKEQYAQVMGAYSAFQHRVKTSIVQVQSHVAQLPGGGKAQMRHSFGTNTVRVMVPSGAAKTQPIDPWKLVVHYVPDYPNSLIFYDQSICRKIQNESIGSGGITTVNMYFGWTAGYLELLSYESSGNAGYSSIHANPGRPQKMKINSAAGSMNGSPNTIYDGTEFFHQISLWSGEFQSIDEPGRVPGEVKIWLLNDD